MQFISSLAYDKLLLGGAPSPQADLAYNLQCDQIVIDNINRAFTIFSQSLVTLTDGGYEELKAACQQSRVAFSALYDGYLFIDEIYFRELLDRFADSYVWMIEDNRENILRISAHVQQSGSAEEAMFAREFPRSMLESRVRWAQSLTERGLETFSKVALNSQSLYEANYNQELGAISSFPWELTKLTLRWIELKAHHLLAETSIEHGPYVESAITRAHMNSFFFNHVGDFIKSLNEWCITFDRYKCSAVGRLLDHITPLFKTVADQALLPLHIFRGEPPYLPRNINTVAFEALEYEIETANEAAQLARLYLHCMDTRERLCASKLATLTVLVFPELTRIDEGVWVPKENGGWVAYSLDFDELATGETKEQSARRLLTVLSDLITITVQDPRSQYAHPYLAKPAFFSSWSSAAKKLDFPTLNSERFQLAIRETDVDPDIENLM